MDPRGDTRPGSRTNLGRRLRAGVAGTIALGGAVFLGGASTMITAFANSGSVTGSQNCTRWSASVTLAGNVLMDRSIDVVSTLKDAAGNRVGPADMFDAHYNTDTTKTPKVIWSGSGSAPVSGVLSLWIYSADVEGAGDSESTTTTAEPGATLEGGPTNHSGYSVTLTPTPNCTSTPAIATTPSGGAVAVGTAIHDVATVTGSGSSPAGDVIFKLFGPADASCTGTPVFTSAASPLTSGTAGTSTATGGSFTPTATGTYHWVASYGGSTVYNPVASKCADEAVVVSTSAPTITTKQSAGGNIGVVLSDTATVAGGSNPTGTVTFNLYGPPDATCTGTPVSTSTGTLTAGSASSGSYTTTSAVGAGTYRWVATYGGDANNAAATSGCQDEAVVVTGGGGLQGISTGPPAPSTGTGSGLTALSLGGFLLLGGLGVALVGAIVPRRHSSL